MSSKSYMTFFGKWTVRGWKAEVGFALLTNGLICFGILIGYLLWGAA